MKIPAEFQHRLFEFISAELIRIDGPQNPTELGWACGEFARRWFGIEESNEVMQWTFGRELISWAERLGKHVGVLWFNQKEG